MPITRCAALVLLVLFAGTVVPAVAGPIKPALSVESGAAGDLVWVELPGAEGGSARHLLRSSAVRVEPGASGSDPSGKAVFVTWTEDGAERWAAYSRDGGATWSEARPASTKLRLLARSVDPGGPLPVVAPSLQLPLDARLQIVQFKTISLPEWREALEDLGVEILRFFPDNGHIVRMDPALAGRVEALEFVERVEPFHPGYRLEPELLAWLEGDGDPLELRVNVVTFGRGSSVKSRLLADAEATGARVAQWFASGHRLELWVTRTQLRSLVAGDEVVWADRWSAPENDMNLVREDGGVDAVESVGGYCGQGVRGEVMDSGIQTDHKDFDNVLLHGQADVSAHGTSTYGIVFGNGDRDGNGDPRALGHMPCAEQGIFADYHQLTDRFLHTQELKAAPYFASFQTNSWGSSTTTLYNSASAEMDDIIFQLDIAITQSQSNTGNRFSRPQAWAKNIIAVGGISHKDTLNTADDSWTNTASIGPAADGRIKPDVSYWNDAIYTTTSGGGVGGSYRSTFGGTSAATPEVAGVLGIMVQMWSDNVWGTNPTGSTVFERQPHFGTIKALLINNAQQYAFDGTTHDLTRVHQGWGRPNAMIARDRAANSFIVDQDQPLGLGQKATYLVDVRSNETELKVTMIFPDPPGTLPSSQARINDVDLTLTSPSGVLYRGNYGLDASPYSSPGGLPSTVDTVENVFVGFPENGTWTVEVEAVEVNDDGHPGTPADDVVFALVVTGAGMGTCGNGIREPGEDCDGDDLGGTTCASLGCDSGDLPGCDIDCNYDTSKCSECPFCGDLVCDPGENCLNCSGDCISQTAQTCGNGLCETTDGEDCATCPADCRSNLSGNPSGRYCCGGGEYAVDCTDDRCTDSSTICLEYPSLAYCCGDATCVGAETEISCAVDCAVTSPGEAGSQGNGMLLADYDHGGGTLSLTYGVGCGSLDHVIEYGELTPQAIATYQWIGQECGIGRGGSYTWTPPALPDSLFFVVVAKDATVEGSYGVDGAGIERPEDTTSNSCPFVQDLTARCD